MSRQSRRDNPDGESPYKPRERAGSSCSSGYGSCSTDGRHDDSINRRSPKRNGNGSRGKNRSGSGGGTGSGGVGVKGYHHSHRPEMTLLCHRVDLFDDFVPSKTGCDGKDTPECLVPVRCLGLEGGCACRTPCSFCHALVEDEEDTCPDDDVLKPPDGVHPGFAFLFTKKSSLAGINVSKSEGTTTISTSLVIDQIFAQNHGLLIDNGDGVSVAVKKYHHPPVGKYRFQPPLLKLSDFFSDTTMDASPPEQVLSGNKGNNAAETENGSQLDAFFDDFALTAQPRKETPRKGNNEESNKKVLVFRTPLKTVKKAITTNGDSETFGKCICHSRYESLKKGSSQPNPHDPSIVHDKYWAQRKRLFKKFDDGIQLDAEGWYSVTPEVVADHVATRFADAAEQLAICSPGTNPRCAKGGDKSKRAKSLVILDAFCGCGGNAIAFAKLPPSVVSLVVCIDVDRTKLRKAAHNASIYNIPPNRIVFVEANSVAVMERCYRDGTLVMDPPPRTAAALSKYPPREIYDDFTIGGVDLLAEYAKHIDAIFMDPPWGGIDYGAMGKDGYDLARDMKIRGCERGCVGFPPTKEVNGVRLLKIAAAATSTRFVVYDLPRNTNKRSLAEAALEAGYEGNSKLEEHYLNGRLKTVTAYFGQDFRHLLDLKKT
mmetsp:Transcript_14699/g.31372  ORF Transcript_14699/g.31372 Transcript_14699/m.31372 type:complete len:657 (-) Transcript_14699:175-2145(-)|eukprot:CAMPEP_0171342816 /NCGR_PEP_ID=MMETSP0878-20121228/15450_1 /TAXON_ID=67004 /ORGANISM="Thalassiosira weissflogii, Strain CCMP1336" /LENGTH=656 /DNA_ID=CAMNT_0011845595 /DNA_START=34 /DNA_END=2004 /DNA_ORIENTATION=+